MRARRRRNDRATGGLARRRCGGARTGAARDQDRGRRLRGLLPRRRGAQWHISARRRDAGDPGPRGRGRRSRSWARRCAAFRAAILSPPRPTAMSADIAASAAAATRPSCHGADLSWRCRAQRRLCRIGLRRRRRRVEDAGRASAGRGLPSRPALSAPSSTRCATSAACGSASACW